MRTLLRRDRRQQPTVETLSTTELLALHEALDRDQIVLGGG